MDVGQPVELQQQTAYCVVSAAHRFSLPPEALLSIMLAEGGAIGTKKVNYNRTRDLGPMQVNTVHIDKKSPLYGYIDEQRLTYDVCANIHTAAWLLAWHYGRVRDIWRAIGMYHSPGNAKLAQRYRMRVYAHLPRARRILNSNPYYGQYLTVFYTQ